MKANENPAKVRKTYWKLKTKDQPKKPEWTIKKQSKTKETVEKQIKSETVEKQIKTKEQKHENYRKTKEHPRKPMKETLISKEQHTEIIPSPIRTPLKVLKLHKDLLFLDK